ncbi:hsp90 co-chaperone Cdc37 [Massospora cicadina]|nr:hsp90 co-chaperone Cdc37 [Massospora cicadina]
MPLDYSKWDNIEISDDEDIEVHPNVDKRSFIKWNREAIHQRRAERRNKIKQLRERVQLNSRVIDKIKRILDGLIQTDRSNTEDILMSLKNCAAESQYSISPLDEEGSQSSKMSLEKLIISMFSQIQADLAKEKLEFSKENVLSKLQAELGKVEDYQSQCKKELEAEEKAESSTLTSDNICKPGFDKTVDVVDSKSSNQEDSEDSEAEVEISDLASAFSKLKTFDESFEFITKYPCFVDERYSDELLAHAFECELKKDYAYAEQLNSEGFEMFKKDAKETYLLLKERAKVIAAKASEDSGKKAIFQLEPASEDSKFVVNIPAEEDIERYKLFTSLPTALQEALKTTEIDPINRALADLSEQEAEQALRICDEGVFLLFDVPSEQPELSQPSISTSQASSNNS